MYSHIEEFYFYMWWQHREQRWMDKWLEYVEV